MTGQGAFGLPSGCGRALFNRVSVHVTGFTPNNGCQYGGVGWSFKKILSQNLNRVWHLDNDTAYIARLSSPPYFDGWEPVFAAKLAAGTLTHTIYADEVCGEVSSETVYDMVWRLWLFQFGRVPDGWGALTPPLSPDTALPTGMYLTLGQDGDLIPSWGDVFTKIYGYLQYVQNNPLGLPVINGLPMNADPDIGSGGTWSLRMSLVT